MQASIVNPDLVQNIRQLLEQTRFYVHQTVNSAMVQAYWHIGRLIVEDEQNGEVRAGYGKQQLEKLSEILAQEYGKGFDVTNLRNMRRFYMAYPIRETLSLELTWSHYCKLIRIENLAARQWYATEAIENNWSVRALDRQISKLYYERLLATQDKVSVLKEAEIYTQELKSNPKNFLRDPYIFDFLSLPYDTLVESDLEKALISNLQSFLLELGKGFAFVERQQRIRTDDEDFYIDLVFYNFKLKCFLLVDLKLGKLSHQDVGQMDTYVRIYDQQKKDQADNPTIGLILCSEKSEAVAKYSVLTNSNQLFASKYLPYLPTEEELAKQLTYQRTQIEANVIV